MSASVHHWISKDSIIAAEHGRGKRTCGRVETTPIACQCGAEKFILHVGLSLKTSSHLRTTRSCQFCKWNNTRHIFDLVYVGMTCLDFVIFIKYTASISWRSPGFSSVFEVYSA